MTSRHLLWQIEVRTALLCATALVGAACGSGSSSRPDDGPARDTSGGGDTGPARDSAADTNDAGPRDLGVERQVDTARDGIACEPGLLGEYFDNMTLTPPVAGSRVDPRIDFDFMQGDPMIAGIGPNLFSIRWTGTLTPPATGVYTFLLQTDDGSRVFIDGVQITSEVYWSDHGADISHTSMPVTLTANRPVAFEMVYYENGGGAAAHLSWQVPGGPLEIVPLSVLSSCLPSTPDGGAPADSASAPDGGTPADSASAPDGGTPADSSSGPDGGTPADSASDTGAGAIDVAIDTSSPADADSPG
jgi:PA14 domain